MSKFSERLKALRLENNLTQKILAEKTGYTQSAITKWEAGSQIPNINVAIVFCKFFNVSADYLLGLED